MSISACAAQKNIKPSGLIDKVEAQGNFLLYSLTLTPLFRLIKLFYVIYCSL
jgi:hypothetical protein